MKDCALNIGARLVKTKTYRIKVSLISLSGNVAEKLFDVEGNATIGEIYSLARAQIGAAAIRTGEAHSISKVEVEAL